ncbi:tRNA lysidine(34) synthetase TilS [Reinekea sp. G2M2-21]|uniref:tRNA lysidine(34) synthetase TilS n=1 Tax=Reinekea sp. G2M2-21 TaxID=2788942 RepID=UPI0018ABDE3D
MTTPSWMADIQKDIQQDILQQASDLNYVGFSGGLDSTFLLCQAVQALGPQRVIAVHVNHGISPHAAQWQQHCETICTGLGCRFETANVNVLNQGQGIEAAARQSRYECFAKSLPDNGLLMLGHHLDDQVETFFLRLMRGAGPTGLTAMPTRTAREHYWIARPLLAITRQQIESIAQNLGLVWIEDDSNKDTRFDRNFLRQQVLPLLETRWPAYRDKIQQTMSLLQPQQLQENDSFEVQAELQHRLSHDQGLKLVQTDTFTDAQLQTLLHAWLASIGQQTPSQARLKAIVDHVIRARPDAQPVVELGDGDIRRHGPALYWVAKQRLPGDAPEFNVDIEQHWPGVGNITVALTVDGTPCLRRDLPNLHWRLRSGDEMMRPFGRSKSRDLKRLLQEYRVKPWLRDRIPLLFSGDSLVAVGDLLVSADHLAVPSELGLRIIWQNSD